MILFYTLLNKLNGKVGIYEKSKIKNNNKVI